ncbi:MAG: CotH kinase family protein [Bacilli bacterium]|nr:CotH kinase family protein [Bacilli bacterium]
MKKNIFVLFFLIFVLSINKAYALEVGQTIDNNQVIYSINSLDIYIKGKETKLENFLSNKWRTYVKLDDLCSGDLNVCKIIDTDNEKIILNRTYEKMDDVYYRTEYVYKSNEYNSVLITPNSLNFSFGKTKTSRDVKPLKIDDELYVPIRFITEALGAEVIYENKNDNQNPRVKIDFYSNMELDFNIEFYNTSTKQNYDFKNLEKNKCYDVKVNFDNIIIKNPKLFTQSENFIKIDYNNNERTNICLYSSPENKSISFVFNYNSVPLLYKIDKTTNENKNLDKIYLTGDMSNISKENEVKLKVKYSGTNLNFEKYATLKWQGSSSIAYEKKNYTIKLFEDENYNNKYKISANNWDLRNKYVLKANYVDYTHARNIVSAKLWGQVVKSRKNVNSRLTALVNGGAIDGYPVELYINDEYYGLYTFNTAKDENLFNMKNDNEFLIADDSWKDDSLFKKTVDFNDPDTGWETIYTGNKTDEEVENSINALINFTINNDGKAFKDGIGNYLDIDASIDYLIYIYYICASDNSAKNMLWASFDSKIWFPSAYDLDSTFGNGAPTMGFYGYDIMLPSIDTNNTIVANTPHEMLLWTRILNNYRDEIKVRYNELRTTILTSDNVIKLFNQFKNQVSDKVYNNNLIRWPNLPKSNEDNYNQIYNFIKNREKVMDEIIEKF